MIYNTVRYPLSAVWTVVICFLTCSTGYGGTFYQSVHGDRAKLLKSCGSCHSGHGTPDQPMLPKNVEDVCFQCHGTSEEISKAKEIGILSKSMDLKDLRTEFSKPYRHLVDPKGVHSPEEMLPEIDPTSKRHVTCPDCHDAHREVPRQMGSPAQGKEKHIANFRNQTYQYEVCYRCHSKSKNLGIYSTDVQEEFNPANRSYHPVEAGGKSEGPVPSLLPPYTTSSIISCTDCHGNDNPTGPKGPHGSVFENILAANFIKGDGSVESTFTYALCYRCHSRDSIIQGQGFAAHRKHIVDVKASCYTCHDSHGSRTNPYLIRFNKDQRFTQVYPIPIQGGPVTPQETPLYRYVPGGGSECYLTCHNVVHNGSAVTPQMAPLSPFRGRGIQPSPPIGPQGPLRPHAPGGRP